MNQLHWRGGGGSAGKAGDGGRCSVLGEPLQEGRRSRFLPWGYDTTQEPDFLLLILVSAKNNSQPSWKMVTQLPSGGQRGLGAERTTVSGLWLGELRGLLHFLRSLVSLSLEWSSVSTCLPRLWRTLMIRGVIEYLAIAQTQWTLMRWEPCGATTKGTPHPS